MEDVVNKIASVTLQGVEFYVRILAVQHRGGYFSFEVEPLVGTDTFWIKGKDLQEIKDSELFKYKKVRVDRPDPTNPPHSPNRHIA